AARRPRRWPGTQAVCLVPVLARAPVMALGWIRPRLRTRQRSCNRSATRVQVTRRGAVSDLVATWTGWHANALRQALRMTNEEIDRIHGAVAALAKAHPLIPATVLLTDARQLQAKIQRMLTGRRLRHRQERELLRVNGGMLAHMSLLFSDLHASRAADDYGNA